MVRYFLAKLGTEVRILSPPQHGVVTEWLSGPVKGAYSGSNPFYTSKNNNMKQKVYLAGGFIGNWQNLVKENIDLVWLDPKEKERGVDVQEPMTLNEYGTWDLHNVKQADIVFVYCESTNPSCIGLSVEAGYAKGLGKTVILVLEKNNTTIKDKYLDFLKTVSDIVFEDLESGIKFLSKFQ